MLSTVDYTVIITEKEIVTVFCGVRIEFQNKFFLPFPSLRNVPLQVVSWSAAFCELYDQKMTNFNKPAVHVGKTESRNSTLKTNPRKVEAC